jgi:hypothetical protein
LQLNLNKGKIYSDIIKNLGIGSLNINSSVYKTTQPVIDELEIFSDYCNQVIKEINVNTASYPTLQKLGGELGIYRRSFNTIDLPKTLEVAYISFDETQSLTSTSTAVLVFPAGSSVEVGRTICTFKEDVYVSGATREYVDISLKLNYTDVFNIAKDTSYSLTPTRNKESVPSVGITFTQSVGIVNIEENIEDYRVRLLQAKGMPSKGYNYILQQAVQEVPGILKIEIDQGSDSTFYNIYTYTKELLEKGRDVRINSFLNLAVTESITQRLDKDIDVQVLPAEPINLMIEIPSTLTLNMTTEAIRVALNIYLQNSDKINNTYLLSILRGILGHTLTENQITVRLKSPNIFESDLELDLNNTKIRPRGRFYYVTTINSV